MKKSKAFSTEFSSKLLYRCSACVFELPLQRCAAALVFFSTVAQRCSGEALQRQHARSAEARSAEDFKICSAALQHEARSAAL